MTEKCAEIVYSTKPGDFKPRRCTRPAGHGKDGAYCSSHSIDNSNIEPLSQKPGKRKIWGSKR